MASPYQIAASMAGSREGQSALTDYLKTGGQNIDPTTRAWCADFVNATLNKAGQKGTDSGMARSFLQWGQQVAAPQKGDVAVFSRGDPNGPSGHVGFFDSVNPDGTIKVLGGNQSDSVSYGNYPADRLLGYRRGGDSMVPRDDSAQVTAAQSTTPTFGSMAPTGGVAGPPPGVSEYAFGDEEKKDNRFEKAGKHFSNAMNAYPAPRPSQFPGGPSAEQSGGLLKAALSNPQALAQLMMQKRLG